MLIKRGKTYHYDFQVDGKRYRGTTGQHDRVKARRFESELMVHTKENYSAELVWQHTKARLAIASEIAFDLPTACELINDSSHASDQRRRIYAGHLSRFFSWAQENGISSYDGMDIDLANKFIGSLSGAAATKNDYINTLRTLFREVLRKMYVKRDNPFDGVSKFKSIKVDRKPFSVEEIHKLSSAATGDMKSIIITCICTGLRLGDICNLRWEYIQDGWLMMPHASKTGKRLEIPMLPAFRKHVASLEGPHEGYLYPSLKMKHDVSPSGICKEFLQLTDSLGMSGHDSLSGYNRQVNTRGIHALRHTFLYMATMNHFPVTLVQDIAQHSDLSTTQMYVDHIDKGTKEKYFALLPDFISESSEKRMDIDTVIEMVKRDADRKDILSALEQLKNT